MDIHIGSWDLLWVAVVSLQATALAYVLEPRWKALVSTLPLPFTVAVLALGSPVDASNILGLVLVFVFYLEVRWLHQRWSVSIVPAIVISALTYSALGALLAPILPDTDLAFWLAAGLVWLFGLALLLKMPYRAEPGHRSPLPVYIKLPVIVGVVLLMIAVKGVLRGFVTVFPAVSIVAAYESRYSLWTIGRQVPVLFVAMVPMMAAIRVAQTPLGLGPALVAGWAVFLCLYVPITWSRSFRRRGPGAPLDAIAAGPQT
jgi:hypothetical protein